MWCGSCPLKCLFPLIFYCCEQKEITVAEALRDGDLNLTFCRSFDDNQVAEWDELREVVALVNISEAEDGIRWDLEKMGSSQ